MKASKFAFEINWHFSDYLGRLERGDSRGGPKHTFIKKNGIKSE